MVWFTEELLKLPPTYTCETDELMLVYTTLGGSFQTVLELSLCGTDKNESDNDYCKFTLNKEEIDLLIDALKRGRAKLE